MISWYESASRAVDAANSVSDDGPRLSRPQSSGLKRLISGASLSCCWHDGLPDGELRFTPLAPIRSAQSDMASSPPPWPCSVSCAVASCSADGGEPRDYVIRRPQEPPQIRSTLSHYVLWVTFGSLVLGGMAVLVSGWISGPLSPGITMAGRARWHRDPVLHDRPSACGFLQGVERFAASLARPSSKD